MWYYFIHIILFPVFYNLEWSRYFPTGSIQKSDWMLAFNYNLLSFVVRHFGLPANCIQTHASLSSLFIITNGKANVQLARVGPL